MSEMTATASNITKTPVGVEADVLVTEENGDTFALRAAIAGTNIQISGSDEDMQYLNDRYTPQVFSLTIRRAVVEADS